MVRSRPAPDLERIVVRTGEGISKTCGGCSDSLGRRPRASGPMLPGEALLAALMENA